MALLQITNEFNAKSQFVEQNIAEAKDTLTCKLETLRK